VRADVPTVMRAAVLAAPGGPDALVVQSVPVPVPGPGWVLIRVRAAGLNRSELHTRLGLAEGVTFPRVLGIEATGEVVDCPGGEFVAGQQVLIDDGPFDQFLLAVDGKPVAWTGPLSPPSGKRSEAIRSPGCSAARAAAT